MQQFPGSKQTNKQTQLTNSYVGSSISWVPSATGVEHTEGHWRQISCSIQTPQTNNSTSKTETEP